MTTQRERIEVETVPTRAGVSEPRISVVIPARNEASNLPYVFGRLPSDVYEVILVDGHSEDGTTQVAQELYPDIRLVMQDGAGKGNALACGIAEARGDIIVMLDADGSTDPAEIPRFVDALRAGADFAKGSRFRSGGGSSDITAFRALGNIALTTIVNLLYGVKYTDLCYGYNAFWRHCLRHVRIDCDGFEVETQINVRLAKSSLNVQEVPSFESSRLHGVSNLNAVSDGWRVLKTIFRERRGWKAGGLRSVHARQAVRWFERRGGRDRREGRAASWTGIERRSGIARRNQSVPEGPVLEATVPVQSQV